ncbi:MAG: Rpn family recombination-promoting nuclease/putative transposase [Spirochaetaceae bacterium]|nr:Rpn family recombination-promoting nuclease/putative transposase [Spirochaetaceae bacterium]
MMYIIIMQTNRKFKDSVFTSLFSTPDVLRELYCALKGISLPNDIPVSINTLENVLFMDTYNDISFEIGGKLVILIEHQSTINPNMAFRLFLYIARVLEKRIEGRTLYSRKPISIPWPEFFVLYNGKDIFPDKHIYKLSDLFEKPNFMENDNPLLELEVKVLNINEGRNKEIINRSKKLSEYCVFITKIHEYWKELGDLEEGIKRAIKYCQSYDILTEYLKTHGSEVLNMILTEWNTEDAIAFARKEEREEGRAEGRVVGREEGRIDGLEEGREEGREKAFRDKLQTVANLKKLGVSIEIISQATSLSVDEIIKI